ncbi:metal ABC transporter substrate-binding protein [Cellulomonas sp. APG4]|uniref:metal ABC transporter substrate-binding protein n=1 Tax=Cellulomonas sp. APG4 TaxID=1538656 RepID=UPI001ED9423A|nr:metal ABC transporter substrate-binding protein [Cellulomonas sp. APG4]
MKRRPLALAVTSVLLLAGCAGTGSGGDDGADGTVEVLASFYPLVHLAEQVGGDAVTVASLTPAGGEPHDVELSPRQVREVGEADLVLVLGGFQPAVDDAVEARSPAHVVDAAQTEAVAAHMAGDEPADEDEHAGEEEHAADGDEHAGEEEHAEDAHAEEGDEHAHDHGGDPHFWLDPTLLAAVGLDLAAELGEADPDHAADYLTRAEEFAAQMDELDAELEAGLADCERPTIVAAHEAYGFLAERYGLEQVGISGLDPEAEPSPARLREIREVVESNGVTTIFTETLVDPKVAETLAADLGITTALLDPVETQVDEDTDYRGAMLNNLAALREGLGCR